MKHFGKEFYRIIEEKGLEKKRIAEEIGMQPTQLSQLMNKETFNVRTLDKLCKAVGVSPGYFFDDWPSEKYSFRDISNSSILGNATVNLSDDSKKYDELLAAKDAIIAEKERLISILLEGRNIDKIVRT
ncbi:MAG: helix-turn-helix domain-containing protein [Muribaculaceae bacterium]|nr:helix-turn-helix domain-containing protein [Muribaculaceae bacterium]